MLMVSCQRNSMLNIVTCIIKKAQALLLTEIAVSESSCHVSVSVRDYRSQDVRYVWIVRMWRKSQEYHVPYDADGGV